MPRIHTPPSPPSTTAAPPSMGSRTARIDPLAAASASALVLALPLAVVLAHTYQAPLLAALQPALASGLGPQAASAAKTVWTYTFHPPLPPVFAFVATVCRILAILFLLPLLVLVLVDVASYAVFRTLGLRRVRVHVRARRSRPSMAATSQKEGDFVAWPGPHAHMAYQHTAQKQKGEKAPLLTPGTYDASTLLANHLARKAGVPDVPTITETPPEPQEPAEIIAEELQEVDPSPVEEQEPGRLDVGVHGPLGWDSFEDESDISMPPTPRSGFKGLSPIQPLHPLAEGVRQRTSATAPAPQSST